MDQVLFSLNSISDLDSLIGVGKRILFEPFSLECGDVCVGVSLNCGENELQNLWDLHDLAGWRIQVNLHLSTFCEFCKQGLGCQAVLVSSGKQGWYGAPVPHTCNPRGLSPFASFFSATVLFMIEYPASNIVSMHVCCARDVGKLLPSKVF